MTWLFALVRATHFASLMTVFGANALLAQSRRIGVAGEHVQGWLRICAFAALASAVVCLCFATGEMTGDPISGFDPTVLGTVVANTFYGHVFLLRLTLLIGLALLSLGGQAHVLKTFVAGAALALMGLTSHAAASGDPGFAGLRAANDALHLLAAGFWVGGLVVILPEVLPRPRDIARLVALLKLFSRWGAVSVAILLAAGTANGVLILGPLGTAWSQTYITLLAIKIVLAGLMVALALTNRFGVVRGLAKGDPEAAQTIPLTVVAELGAALLILVIVGFLGLTAPMQM
ncbi:MAG TPA: CopD family protein [Rhizomicrobium sp.]|nr:CopD family protein [Rhizomicrobium sp.]